MVKFTAKAPAFHKRLLTALQKSPVSLRKFEEVRAEGKAKGWNN